MEMPFLHLTAHTGTEKCWKHPPLSVWGSRCSSRVHPKLRQRWAGTEQATSTALHVRVAVFCTEQTVRTQTLCISKGRKGNPFSHISRVRASHFFNNEQIKKKSTSQTVLSHTSVYDKCFPSIAGGDRTRHDTALWNSNICWAASSKKKKSDPQCSEKYLKALAAYTESHG